MSLERLDTGEMVCSYNGYTFGPTAYTSAFSVKPNMDPARRTVMSATYKIKVSETIAGATTTSPDVLDAIQRLSRNAGKLRYEGRGFGDLEINFFGAQRDVAWGPITTSVGCEAVGAGIAVRLTWEFEFTTVNCPDGLTNSGQVLQFTYTVSDVRDKDGYTTRTYDASLTIAQTKITVADARLTNTADSQLEKMTPPIPVGFRPMSRSSRLSLDKCTLTLTIVFAQMPPYMPPVGVVDGSIEQSFNTGTGAGGILNWTASLSATYDIARPHGTPDMAVNAFLALMRNRLDYIREAIVGAGVAGAKAGGKAAVILIGSSVSDPNLLGRTQVKIGVKYFLAGVGLSEILRTGGLWRPPPDVLLSVDDPNRQWKVWSTSKSISTALSARGSAALSFTPGEDKIVDACVPSAKPVLPSGFVGTIPGLLTSGGGGGFLGGVVDFFKAFQQAFPPPDQNSSWIHYKNTITIHPDLGRVSGGTLPDEPLPTYSSNRRANPWNPIGGLPNGSAAFTSPFPPLDGLLTTGSAGSSNSGQGGETFYQQRNRPSLMVTMTGEALRAGYDIPIPELVAVNGTKPVLVGNPMFTSGVVANCSVPIIGAKWSMTYLFTDEGGTPSGGFGALPNPLFA